jgi:hypothetical protein
MYTARVSELMCPLAVLYPDDRGPGAHTTDWVNLGSYHRAFLVLEVGDMGALATVDCYLQEATDTTGTGAQNIAGKAITQLTQAGGDASSLVGIELRTEEMDVNNDYDCVRAYITTAVNTVIFSAVLYGVESRFAAVPTTEWAEIVA